MVGIPCAAADCPTNYSTPEGTVEVMLGFLKLHMQHNHQQAAPPTVKAPSLVRPTIEPGSSEETWQGFSKKWKMFSVAAGLDARVIGAQLFSCCDTALQDILLKENTKFDELDEQAALKEIKKMAVVPVSTGVRRAELLAMAQDSGEGARAFHARVKGKAAICGYSTAATCTCGANVDVDFTDVIIKDVFVSGLSDDDIKRESLGWTDLDKSAVQDVVQFVEGKEMARDAMAGASGVSAASSFKKVIKRTPTRGDGKSETRSEDEIEADLKKTAKCGSCGEKYNLFKRRGKRVNKHPYDKCFDCFAKNKESAVGGFSVLGGVRISPLKKGSRATTSHKSDLVKPQDLQVPLGLKVFAGGDWKPAMSQKHPKVNIKVHIDPKDYEQNGMMCPPTGEHKTDGVTDSGAQLCLFPRRDLHKIGLTRSDLFKVRHTVYAANRTPITIDGAVFLRIGGTSTGSAQTGAMVFVSPDATGFFLSEQVLKELGIIPENFPEIGSSSDVSGASGETIDAPSQEIPDCNSRSMSGEPDTEEKCFCLKRTPPPKRPTKLPFVCRPENNSRMKEYCLNRFASSTFLQCTHQTIPTVDGPPIRIHVDKNAVPFRAREAAKVPLHFAEKVKEGLLKDERMGVIERVPPGTPTKFCSRMVITRKSNGEPRRTVDLSALNKQSKREIHSNQAPFQLARSITAGTWKSVVDAWNGYHSLEIHPDDRHLTTFMTDMGLFQYVRAPQGFLSSGDGYNRRMDELVCAIERLVRCVDDHCLYDTELEAHWWRMLDLLELLGNAGIVLNPEKFQFAQREVDFAGFRVTDSSVEPLPKYLDSIREFPTPQNITDIRSWFGLVNQASHYDQLRDRLEPFRKFLRPSIKFEWTPELDKIFEESKTAIIEAIREGVAIFDVKRPTCLRTDWSDRGIGFYLGQKYCECLGRLPGCCDTGWRITLAGSRFLQPAESRYCPVEGEALAVAWSLEQTRFFTWGCDDLEVVTDHQPLVKILGNRSLEEIRNVRLFRLTQRTLPWIFRISYLPGDTNDIADCLSRYPSSTVNVIEMLDDDEGEMVAAIQNECKKLLSLTWERIREATAVDKQLQELMRMTMEGFPNERDEAVKLIGDYWKIRDAVYIQDGVVLYKDRIIVPQSLRQEALSALHAANQGVTSMASLAQGAVYWPGITEELVKTRQGCRTCNREAPSQPKTPPSDPEIPSTPFECVVADYADVAGSHYLITGDRLSGWVEIWKVNQGSSLSGAKGLIAIMREWIGRFGAPKEVSSDGGPEFVAKETKEFFEQWGIKHRKSSAYHSQSNGRAEAAVKSAKRALMDNVDASGSLNTDKIVRALLAIRNTPNTDCKKSPAEIIFNRKLRGLLPMSPFKDVGKFDCQEVDPVWKDAWELKELALRKRAVKSMERLGEHSRNLKSLTTGDHVFIQNQSGRNKTKWEKSGQVMERKEHNQYLVRVDGTGRITARNRRFLRRFDPDVITPTSMANTFPASPLQTQPSVLPKHTTTSPPHAPVSPPQQAASAPVSPPQQAASTPRRPGTESGARRLSLGHSSPTPPSPPPATQLPPTPSAASATQRAEFKRLANHNNPGLLENQFPATRLRPRK